MKRFLVIIAVFFCFSTLSFSQMWNGIDSLFGNEWIQYDQQYVKMLVAEDGVYRVNKQTLEDAGVPMNSVTGAQFQLFSMGQETPIHVSNSGALGSSDYIEFYGKKNRSELDYHVFGNPEEDLFNPRYSLYTDTAAYFLTWNVSSNGARFTETPNNLTNLPPKETAYMEELEQVLSSHYSKEYGHQTVRNSYFETAEGFGSQYKKTQSFTLSPTNVAINGSAGNLHIRYATDYGGGSDVGNGVHDQHITINGVEVANDETFRFQVLTHDFSIVNADLANTINIGFNGETGSFDKQSIAHLQLTYPRQFNFDNANSKYFKIASSPNVRYLEIENFNTNGVHILYDLTNNLRLEPTEENGILRIALPPSATERELVLMNENGGIQNITTAQSVNFTDFSDHQANYFIVSHPDLMNPDNEGVNRVGEYADYRASSAGGSYLPLVIDINQLYDQFAYGVARHPISVRNFANKLRKIENLPEYFFLIGKGREYQTYRTAAQINNPTDLPLLVPSFGYPCSDRMLISSNTKATPVTSIGRLPAVNSEDIRIYLDKVREFEDNQNNPSTIEDRAWMKRVVHLGGGNAAAGEQEIIRNHLINLGNILENSAFGGEVNGFYRGNSNPVEVSNNEQMFNLINSGVNTLTFFGHGSANSFDFNIDNFDNFDNKGKYPFMFALGCSIGNVHTSFKAVGERFVFGHEDKGMIAFVASSSFGFISALRSQMGTTYDLMGNEMYGETIGNIMRETTRVYDTPNNILAQQNTLNGDPALRFNPFEGPDMVVDASSVKFNPTNIHTELSNFDLSFDVVNIGKGVEDSITLRIQQKLPNNQLETPVITKIKTPFNRKTLTYQIPTYGKPSVGLNRVLITLDTENEQEELPNPAAEQNNELKSSIGELGMPFYIQDNGITSIYPPEFAIVNTPDVVLNASTANAIAAEAKYIMQLDTTENFDSPFLMERVSVQKGGLFKWQPAVNWMDEQVYYWRVSPDSIAGQGYVWDESSFVYLSDSEEGWNQSDFGQYVRNELGEMQFDTLREELQFGSQFSEIRIRNQVYVSSLNKPEFFGGGISWFGMFIWDVSSFNAGIEIIVLEPNTANFWINNSPGDYGSINNSSPLPCFSFKSETLEDREKIIEFLEETVPENHTVIFYSAQKSFDEDYYSTDWVSDSINLGKNIFSILENEGAQKIRDLTTLGSVPYIFAYVKGGNVLYEKIAATENDVITQDIDLERYLEEGNFSSKIIGPATEWENLYWKTNKDDIENDTVYLSIYGLSSPSAPNNEVELSVRVEGDTALNFIDANLYPYLKLKYNAKDAPNRTPAQIDYWRVTYKGITELAVNPNAEFEFYQDTLQQGETFRMKYAIENLSSRDADSLLIRYSIVDNQNEARTQYNRIAPLERFGQTTTEFSLDTRDLSNIQNVLVEINPDDDQIELTHINNFINSQFFVERDNRNPILDVTFDGLHIMDGDLISPTPIIAINLQDENKFLELVDTSLFKLSILYPEEGEPRNISFDSEEISFFPATLNQGGGKNEAKIEYSPNLLVDGTYTLIVEARDATGNQSGDLQFRISFEVINRNMISSILNYPNPFSTSTRFVYTLTGNEPPAFFKIQIMTVSGRIIREITQNEIGPLQTGTHTTEYAWDGTDEFGDRLANGVYLYRVTAQKSDGSTFESIETGADKFVKKGFGKMVLVR